MFYQRIENAIAICSEHVSSLDPTNMKDKELETYLVAVLVVLIVSEYEDHLESVFVKRAEQCGDAHATNYIKKRCLKSSEVQILVKLMKRLAGLINHTRIHF